MTVRRSRHDSHADRLLRARVLDALEARTRQFKSYEGIWPFRIPHEPLALADIMEDAGISHLTSIAAARDLLRPRTVLEMHWPEGHVWTAWAVAFATGIILYCDDDGDEARVLASVKRGNPSEADGFFLELLAETRGQAFGMEMTGGAPERVRTSIGDRDFLVDVFVELFEDTPAASSILEAAESDPRGDTAKDFRADVERWLARTLVGPPAVRSPRRQTRRRDAEPTL
jgi:hypothetical protein